MKSIGTVAIVGRSNVGKSSLFNRLIKDKYSIVSDVPGTTRDRIIMPCEWNDVTFHLIDTGGIEIKNLPFLEEIKIQVDLAIDEADLILFVVDGRNPVTNEDLLVSKKLLKTKKPIICVVNKLDNEELQNNLYTYYSLKMKKLIGVSCSHGIGVGDLLDEIVKSMPKQKAKLKENKSIKFCLVGRTNVGKSTLVNSIIGSKRVITSNLENTTRDAIDIPFKYEGKDFTVIDTAGLRKKGKLYEALDKYAALRAIRSIEKSDIVLLVIDSFKGILEQDKHIIQYAIENYKPVIIVANKWDLVKNVEQNEFKEKIKKEFKFLDYSFIEFVSALNRRNIDGIMKSVLKSYESYNLRVSTSLLNQVINEATLFNEAPDFNGGRLKIKYVSQVSTMPPTFVLFANNKNYQHFSYLRFIENRIRESFDLFGTPIKLIVRDSKE